MGVRVRASIDERETAIQRVTANSKKNFPSIPGIRVIGAKIAIRASVVAITAKVISFEPTKAALTRCLPIS